MRKCRIASDCDTLTSMPRRRNTRIATVRAKTFGRLTRPHALPTVPTPIVPAAPLIPATKRALLIGINYYGQTSELAGCVQDIDDMAAYLATAGYTDIRRVCDDKANGAIAPTRANIADALRQVVAATGDRDTLYVHYSGHGSNVRDLNGDEADKLDECLCPVDFRTAGVIIDDDLYAWLVTALPKTAKLRVVFDSCHSGSCLDLPLRWLNDTEFAVENKHADKKDVVMLSGCRDAQTSADASFGGRPNGALTRALLNSLAVIRAPNKSSSSSWRDLVELVRAELAHGHYSQLPQLSMLTREQLFAAVDIV